MLMTDFGDFLRTMKFAIDSFRGHWPDREVTRQWLNVFDKFSSFSELSDQALRRLEETLGEFWLEGHEETTRVQLLEALTQEAARRSGRT
jgi:hypothetical protein